MGHRTGQSYELAQFIAATNRNNLTIGPPSIFKGFFTDKRGETTPLSDHFGVRAEFVFKKAIKSALSVDRETTPVALVDAIDVGKETEKAQADAACLREVDRILSIGRTKAIAARHLRLWRAVAFFVAAVAIVAMHVLSIVAFKWSWVVVVGLAGISGIEYVLAFFFLTFECSAFTELLNEVQLQLHLQEHRMARD
ncbi:hypothetical protein CCR75_009150 [Bremia lactucae]|uniref:Uncharacterized protein n=1 Tax=Bremia lactucae TaxID=4779 RepID=A0A976FLR0_BRELC|nr:hypothetical protein CCR75_009150 [Bremia lactucae]